MVNAFGDKVTLPASDTTKEQMDLLYNSNYFRSLRHIWMLGAAIGIAEQQTMENENRNTFQGINSLDPDNILASIMVGLYPEKKPDERAKLLVDYAEWGINDLYQKYKKGMLDFSKENNAGNTSDL